MGLYISEIWVKVLHHPQQEQLLGSLQWWQDFFGGPSAPLLSPAEEAKQYEKEAQAHKIFPWCPPNSAFLLGTLFPHVEVVHVL